MSNIDKFDEYVGRIFGILYENFPIPIELTVERIIGLDESQSAFNNPDFEDEVNFATSTVSWLEESKYIYIEKLWTHYAENVVLSEKALLILKSVPDSLKEKEKPLGVRCKDAIKSGSKAAIKTLANEALSLGIKMTIQL